MRCVEMRRFNSIQFNLLIFTLFRKIIIHWKGYSYIMIFGMKILKKVLNYDIEIVHGDQSSS